MKRRALALSGINILPVLFLLSCSQGCADADRFEWEGEHVTVHGDGYSALDVCAGSLPALEQRISMVKDFLGIHSTPHFEYWWVAEEQWEQSASCPADVPGCACWHKAWALRLPDMHEATHMILSSLDSGGCPPILSEGLAEHFDDGFFTRRSPSEEFDIEELIDHERLPLEANAYTRAAHFTSYLLDTYGPEAVVELCRAIPRDDSVADWQAAVSEIIDLTFEDVLFLYEVAYPTCTSDQVRARLWGCAGVPDFVIVSGDPQREEYRFETNCTDERTTNAALPAIGGAATTRLIYLPDDQWLTIEAHAEGPSGTPARFMLQQCVSCYDEPVAVRSGDPGFLNISNLYDVDAGFYEVTLFFNRRDMAELSIRVGY